MNFPPNSLFDDLAKMAGGALNTADAMRQEAEQHFKAKMDAFFRDRNLVTREEFEALQASFRQTREELAALRAEVAALKETSA
jgi:BMFP domain-containing protein YqiC